MGLQVLYGWEVPLMGVVLMGGMWEGVVREALLRGVMFFSVRHLQVMGISREVMDIVWRVMEISWEVMELTLLVREERRGAREDVAGVGVEL